MADTPAVTVVIPTLNRAELVPQAVASVLAQDVGDFELLVVDDGSTEDLAAALAEPLRDPRVRLLRHETNRGPAAARNTGIEAARGEVVAFLDADDTWAPEKLGRQLDALKAAPAGTDVACTGYLLRRPFSGEEEVRIPADAVDNWFSRLLWVCDLSPGSTMMVRREVFGRIGRFDEQLRRLEDRDWLLTYARQGRILVVPQVLATINLSHGADLDEVRHAHRVMFERYADDARRLGPAAWRTFRAAMAVEMVSTAYWSGHYAVAIRHLASALLIMPPRHFSFYRLVLRRAAQAWRRRLAGSLVW
ncbi:MAG: glycosyltransferase family 2 protein [Alphaproteobacteria bacterium]